VSERAPYSRVYWSVMDDPKFDGIREDMRLMGSWLTLLVAADMAWPAPAYPPMIVPKAAVKALVEAGLVDSLSGGRYRIHGLDKERAERASTASANAHKRWDRPDTGRNATALPLHSNGTASQAKPSQDETSLAEAPRDPADIYWSLTGKYPTDKVLSWVDDLTAKYGPEATIRAVVKAHTEDRATSTLLGRAQDVLRAGARELDRQERTHEQARLAEKRAIPRAEEPWRIEYRAAIERQYREGAA
jgi:hypothetical protein